MVEEPQKNSSHDYNTFKRFQNISIRDKRISNLVFNRKEIGPQTHKTVINIGKTWFNRNECRRSLWLNGAANYETWSVKCENWKLDWFSPAGSPPSSTPVPVPVSLSSLWSNPVNPFTSPQPSYLYLGKTSRQFDLFSVPSEKCHFCAGLIIWLGARSRSFSWLFSWSSHYGLPSFAQWENIAKLPPPTSYFNLKTLQN